MTFPEKKKKKIELPLHGVKFSGEVQGTGAFSIDVGLHPVAHEFITTLSFHYHLYQVAVRI